MRLESGMSLQQEVGWDRETLRMARYLADSQSEPFIVSSLSNISDQLRSWGEKFPAIQPTYSVGGNDMGEVLQCLKTLEVPFNINSKQELNKLVELGFSQNTTTFSNSVKLGSHIRAAQAFGVNTLYCDSVEELGKIKKFHGSSRILIQITCEENKNTSQLGQDFGASIADLPNILLEARNLKVHVEGIALNLKITNNDFEDSIHKIKHAVKVAERAVNIGAEHGCVFNVLHLGQFCYGASNISPEFVAGVHTALKSASLTGLNLTADATHFLVCSSVTLAAKIIAVRERKRPSCMQYYINEGVFGAFSHNLISEDYLVSAPLPLGGGKNRKGLTAKLLDTCITGPSGDELDEVLDDIVLPRMEEGDWLLFPNMGTMNLTEFGSEMKIEGNNLFIYLRKREKLTGVKPCPGLQRAWQGDSSQDINLDLQEPRKIEFPGGTCLKGEIDLGKTFIYEK